MISVAATLNAVQKHSDQGGNNDTLDYCLSFIPMGTQSVSLGMLLKSIAYDFFCQAITNLFLFLFFMKQIEYLEEPEIFTRLDL